MTCILINCGNLHGGGVIQVATSFLFELQQIKINVKQVDIFVSSEILKNIESYSFPPNIKIILKNQYGLKALPQGLFEHKKKYRLSFTLFGPAYLYDRAQFKIVGFAQPWISSVDPIVIPSLKKRYYFWYKLKYKIQEILFSKYDVIVVEIDHVKSGLKRKKAFKHKRIHIINNTIGSIYLSPEKWLPVTIINDEQYFKVGYITRDYPHKNIAILTKVASILSKVYNAKIKFFFTLTEKEWAKHKKSFGDFAENVGPLEIAQCPSFYQKMNMTVFPSLLECFSVTPLETLFMGIPLAASDRGFVRDVCHDAALYFDPLNPHDIAQKIYEIYQRQPQNNTKKSNVLENYNPKDRAIKYVNLIHNYLN